MLGDIVLVAVRVQMTPSTEPSIRSSIFVDCREAGNYPSVNRQGEKRFTAPMRLPEDWLSWIRNTVSIENLVLIQQGFGGYRGTPVAEGDRVSFGRVSGPVDVERDSTRQHAAYGRTVTWNGCTAGQLV